MTLSAMSVSIAGISKPVDAVEAAPLSLEVSDDDDDEDDDDVDDVDEELLVVEVDEVVLPLPPDGAAAAPVEPPPPPPQADTKTTLDASSKSLNCKTIALILIIF